MPSTWLMTRSAEQSLQAGQIAQSTLEQFRAGDLSNRTNYDCDPVSVAGTQFRPRVSISPVAGKPNLKLIRVTVSWEGGKNRSHTTTRQVEVFWLPP